jgi:hypothetical protein
LRQQTVIIGEAYHVLSHNYNHHEDDRDSTRNRTKQSSGASSGIYLGNPIRGTMESVFKKTENQLVAAARRAKQEIVQGLAAPMDYDQL